MRPPQRYLPLSAGEVLGQTFEGYRRHFGQFIRVTAPMLLAASVVLYGGLFAIWWSVLSKLHKSTDNFGQVHYRYAGTLGAGAIAWRVVASLIVLLVAMGFWITSHAGTAAIIGQGYIGTKPDWRAALRVASHRLPSLLWAFVASGLLLLGAGLTSAVLLALLAAIGSLPLTVLGSIAIDVGWVFVSICLSVLTPTVLMSSVRGFSAVSECFRLVRGRWWATFGVEMVIGIVIGILGLIAFGIFGLAGGTIVGVHVVGLLAVLGIQVVLQPLSSVAISFIYFDLRNRKGGIYPEDVAKALEIPEPPGGFRGATPPPPTGPWGPAGPYGGPGYPPPGPPGYPPGGPGYPPAPGYPPPQPPAPGYPPPAPGYPSGGPGYPPPGPPGYPPGGPGYPPPPSYPPAPGYPPPQPPAPAYPPAQPPGYPSPGYGQPPSAGPPGAAGPVGRQPGPEQELRPLPPFQPSTFPMPQGPTGGRTAGAAPWPSVSPKPARPRPPGFAPPPGAEPVPDAPDAGLAPGTASAPDASPDGEPPAPSQGDG